MELRQLEAGDGYVSLALIGSLDMKSIASVETQFLVATVGVVDTHSPPDWSDVSEKCRQRHPDCTP